MVQTLSPIRLLHASNPRMSARSMAATSGITAYSTKTVLTTAHLHAIQRIQHQQKVER